MRGKRVVLSAVGIGLLTLAVMVTFFVPGPLTPNTALSVSGSEGITITGIVRDFPSAHPDFSVTLGGGQGHVAGNVQTQLGPNDVPAFIQPTSAVTDFEIVDGVVIPGQSFAAQVTVLGSALETGSYHCPTTMRTTVGTSQYAQFGPYDQPADGNLNDFPQVTGDKVPGSNPREFVLPEIYAPGAPISIEALSWLRKSGVSGTSNSHWDEYLESNSAQSSPRVYALRDGDPVPDTPGLNDQASIAQYVSEYVDLVTNTITLESNEVIYLFELGVTNLSSPAADFQDMVVLITLASHPSYFDQETTETGTESSMIAAGAKVLQQWRNSDGNAIAPHIGARGDAMDSCGNALSDSSGAMGPPSAGGITSAETYDQWFRNRIGTNLASLHSITLVDDGTGVYEYSTDSFYPADDALLGNENADHNYFFTYAFDVRFEYDTCTNQFLQFAGTDDVWVFVNNELVMDLGGVVPGSDQYVYMDRLGLTDGQSYELQLFYAQRQTEYADFHLRTNILLESTGQKTAGGGYD